MKLQTSALPVTPQVHPQSAGSLDWVNRLRALHGDQPGPEVSAVVPLRELRDGEP